MNTLVSLLRGINVGPTKTVKMEDLVALYESLGLKDVRTYLRSGNVLFDSPGTDLENVSVMLEEQITRSVGFPVKVLVRTGDHFQDIIRNNPFLQGISHDIKGLHVTFLSTDPPGTSVNEVHAIKDQVDRFIIAGKEVYLLCPKGYGRTRFSNTFFEKKLGVAATTRNWKTVTTLAEMAKGNNT
jgi:uncharacterized protein (DUF1697 family)